MSNYVQPVRLTPELHDAIVTLAESEGRPVAQMARVLIERGLGMTELGNARGQKNFEKIWRTYIGRGR